MYECRCDERLKTKDEESTRLVYTGFLVELEHLKKLIRKVVALVRVLPSGRYTRSGAFVYCESMK